MFAIDDGLRRHLFLRWAAFFASHGLPYRIGPDPLATWQPDFLVGTNDGGQLLAKIEPHCDEQSWRDDLPTLNAICASLPECEVALLGYSPYMNSNFTLDVNPEDESYFMLTPIDFNDEHEELEGGPLLKMKRPNFTPLKGEQLFLFPDLDEDTAVKPDEVPV